MAQALLVGGFQQSRPELTMHFNRCPNDCSGSRVSLVCCFVDWASGTRSPHGKNSFTTESQRTHLLLSYKRVPNWDQLFLFSVSL